LEHSNTATSQCVLAPPLPPAYILPLPSPPVLCSCITYTTTSTPVTFKHVTTASFRMETALRGAPSLTPPPAYILPPPSLLVKSSHLRHDVDSNQVEGGNDGEHRDRGSPPKPPVDAQVGQPRFYSPPPWYYVHSCAIAPGPPHPFRSSSSK
jgi:hypothetical protein